MPTRRNDEWGVNVPRCPHDTIHAPSTTTRSAPPFRLYVSLAAVYAWIGPSINVTTLHGPLTLDSEGRVAITAGSASRAAVTRSAVVRITAIHAGAGIGDATRQANIGGGGYTVPCGQAQDACGRFLPDTAQASFGRGTGKAAAAVAGGSFGFGRGTPTAAAAGAADGGCCFVPPGRFTPRRIASSSISSTISETSIAVSLSMAVSLSQH
jgi:hypothetical protein